MIVPSPQLITGPLDQLRTLEQLSDARVLLVSDAGLTRAGHLARAHELVAGVAREVRTFASVTPNPTDADVAACIAAADGADAIVAVGGGSVLDVAKLTALLRTVGGEVADHVGVHQTRRGDGVLVLVPTTAGTGSDGQAAAIVSDAKSHRKMACLAPGLAADVVLLDATLTLSCPPEVTAASGLDAITHAVEVVVTTARTPESDALATRAFVAAMDALPRILSAPDDLEARQAMLVAAHEAGLAIAHSMLGAAHAAGNALTARYGTPHGLAVGQMLPAVVRYNGEDDAVAVRYERLASAAGLGASVEALVERLEALWVTADVPNTDIVTADIPALAAEAASQWTGRFNPRPMDEAGFAALFEVSA